MTNLSFVLTDINIVNTNRRTIFSSKITFKSISIISNILSYTYYIRIKCNNNLLNNMNVNPIDSFQLLYKNDIKAEGNLVSKIADLISVKK